MRSAILPLAVGAMVSACKLQFTEPPRDTPAFISVTVTSTDSAGGKVRLRASVAPGHNERSVRRKIEEVIEISGVPVPPTGRGPSGNTMYEREWSFAPGTADPLVVELRAPRIEGLDAEPPQLVVQLPHRVGPELLSVARGDSIPLRISQAVVPAGSRRLSWQVTVAQNLGGPSIYRMGSEGLPPSTITLPGGEIPADAVPELWVRLSVTALADADRTDRRYTAVLALTATSFWRLRLR